MAGNISKIGGGGFHHIAIRARDYDVTYRFYVEGLGFREKIRWGEGDKRCCMLDMGDGNYIEIFSGRKEDKPEGAILHYALRTTDCDAAVEAARAAGAKITHEAKTIVSPTTPGPTTIRLAFCKGPDGEIIEFFQNETT